MSLFRKPKKIQRRVFSSNADDDEEQESLAADNLDMEMVAPPPPVISKKEKSKRSNSKCDLSETKQQKPKALLSFADDEDDAEVFQVRKSSHSKKMMRMMDKERRKKKREERVETQIAGFGENGSVNGVHGYSVHDGGQLGASAAPSFSSSTKNKCATKANINEQCKNNKKSDNIQTEIRTDDFVLVVKKSETPAVILNGRAAVCAGRDDMSDEDIREEQHEDERQGRHRFSKPEHLKQMLESGSIPDAAMIHAARKRRQRAREQGDYVPIEEPKEQPKLSSRLPREDMEGDQSDDEERMDMNDITGRKEREERREQFYAVENDLSDEDSDRETHEWENQQIRKGVTGAQLVNAQHETVLSRFMIKPHMTSSAVTDGNYPDMPPQSTSTLLEQAYAKHALDKSQKMLSTATKVKRDNKAKPVALRTPQEIREALKVRLQSIKALHEKHTAETTRMISEMSSLRLEDGDCKQKAPTAAAKYRFYQEVKCYVNDLVDCLNEKYPTINELERRCLQIHAKHQSFLMERRRQDVRDQAKEMAEASKPAAMIRRTVESEEQVRRAAEREGRRTRRRCERERNNQLSTHLDGMSSDEETPDQYQDQLQQHLAQVEQDALAVYDDVNDEFHKIDLILMKFYTWRSSDFDSYKDAFVSLCLPKALGLLVRMEMLQWSPLLAEYKDIENMNWYGACMLYACSEQETLEQLKADPDVNLVPILIERIVLPKLTEIVKQCWDPMSTTQTLRLISFVNRLGRDYPLKESNKHLKQLFEAIVERMRLALENDVFIPIFPKQVLEAKTSFFQRQFCSGLKLFRNFLSWQGIVADKPLRELAIGAVLNRYLLMAMRICNANDAISKAYIIVHTLPTVWLQPNSETLKNLEQLINYIRQTLDSCDASNPLFMQSCDKAKQILQRLHSL